MPKVTAKPEGQTNGDLMTQFTEVATKKSLTYTYERPQNHLYVSNEGVADIEVKVAEHTRQLRPGDNFGKEIEFDRFSIKALTEDADLTNAYSAYATEYGYAGKPKVEDITVNKPGVNTVGQPEETDVDTNSTTSTSK